MKPTADPLIGDLEIPPGLGVPGIDRFHGALEKIKRGGGGVSLEITARSIALQRIAPFWNSPFESRFGQIGRLGQRNSDSLPGGLDVPNVDRACESSGPEPGQWPPAAVQSKVLTAARLEPARREHPGVILLIVPLLRLWDCDLVPG